MGLCDQTARSIDGAVSKSRRLLSDVHAGQSSVHSKLQDDTFCQFCTVAVSYIKVSILDLQPRPSLKLCSKLRAYKLLGP